MKILDVNSDIGILYDDRLMVYKRIERTDIYYRICNVIFLILKSMLSLFMMHNVIGIYIRITLIVAPMFVFTILKTTIQNRFNYEVFFNA